MKQPTPPRRPVPPLAPPPADNGQADNTVIIRPVPQGRMIVPPGTPARQWPTTLDGSPASMVTMLNALNAPDIDLDEGGFATFDLAHVFAHPVERIDEETGEVHQYSRLVMITPNGNTFATTSVPVAHRVAALLDLVHAGLIVLPVKCRVRARKSRKSGRIYHELTVILWEG